MHNSADNYHAPTGMYSYQKMEVTKNMIWLDAVNENGDIERFAFIYEGQDLREYVGCGIYYDSDADMIAIWDSKGKLLYSDWD
jgi:hypothetical protein